MNRKIAVVGAGLMGAGIVQVSIDKGYDVVMKDTNDAGLYRGLNQIQKGLDAAVKRKRISTYVSSLIKITTNFNEHFNTVFNEHFSLQYRKG